MIVSHGVMLAICGPSQVETGHRSSARHHTIYIKGHLYWYFAHGLPETRPKLDTAALYIRQLLPAPTQFWPSHELTSTSTSVSEQVCRLEYSGKTRKYHCCLCLGLLESPGHRQLDGQCMDATRGRSKLVRNQADATAKVVPVLFLTQAWVLLKWKFTQLNIFIVWQFNLKYVND